MTATAAWYHCSVKTFGRSAGRSVVAAAAYRLGDRLHEEEIDQTHDYRRRYGVVGSFTMAPADAPVWSHSPERLWNAANAAETRKNSTLARECELALPAAVDAKSREGIARAFSQALVERYGVAVSAAIHAPSRHGDDRNHHAHILFTTRRMTPTGLGPKTRVLDDRKTGPKEIAYLRELACDLINQALADSGSDERVDHRSFATRGIEAEPSTHLGPAGTALDRRDEPSERAALNDDIESANQNLDELVAELAALNREIAAEQERQLDVEYGTGLAGPEPGEERGGGFILPDDLAADGRSSAALDDPAPLDPPPGAAAPPDVPGPAAEAGQGDAPASVAIPAGIPAGDTGPGNAPPPPAPALAKPGFVARALSALFGHRRDGEAEAPLPNDAIAEPTRPPASPSIRGEQALAAFFGGGSERSPPAPSVPTTASPLDNASTRLRQGGVVAPADSLSQDLPADSATATAQVRAAAALFPIDQLRFGVPHGDQPTRTDALPRFEAAAADAATAAAQVRAAAEPFITAIRRWGGVRAIVVNLIEDGLDLMQRTADHVSDLADAAREKLLTWRDHARIEQEERNHDDMLDFD